MSPLAQLLEAALFANGTPVTFDDLAALEAQIQVRQDEPFAVTEVDVAKLEKGLGGGRHEADDPFTQKAEL